MRKLSRTLIGLAMSVLLLCAYNESTAASGSNLTATCSGTWVRKADMPTARNRFSVSVVGGKIYAIGGSIRGGYSSEGQSTVEEYDPVTNVWTKKTDMPTARQWLSTTVVNGKIYAIGGLDSYFGKVLRTVEVYDPVSDSWAKKADMPTSRAGVSLCTVGGKIYAIGGFDPSSGLRTVEVYDPRADRWTKRSEMPTKRLGHSASVVNGRIYVIGGSPWGIEPPHKTVEEYNLHTDIWKTKGYTATPRMGISAGVVNGKIYVIGGSASYSSMPLAIVEEYDPGLNSQATPQGKSPLRSK